MAGGAQGSPHNRIVQLKETPLHAVQVGGRGPIVVPGKPLLSCAVAGFATNAVIGLEARSPGLRRHDFRMTREAGRCLVRGADAQAAGDGL